MVNSILFKILLLFLFIGVFYFILSPWQWENTTKKDSRPTAIPTIVGDTKAYVLTLSATHAAELKELIVANEEAKEAYEVIEAKALDALRDTPNPIEKITSSGIIKGDPRKTRSLESVKDAEKVYALAIAYTVSGEDRYGQKAKDFLISWAKENTSSDDPIDQRLLVPMIFGYDLLQPVLSEDEKEIVNTWLRDTAQTLIENINLDPSATSSKNNHQSHLLMVVGMIGFATEDNELIRYVIEGYKKHIAVNLLPDGSSFDLHERDALYYHVFTLEPLLILVRVAAMNGIDLYGYQTSEIASQSASLQKSVDFLLPYVRGEKTHEEWVNSTAPFDKERAKNGEEQFESGVFFDPKQAFETMQLYYYFNPEILPLILKLSDTKVKKYPDFQMLYLDILR